MNQIYINVERSKPSGWDGEVCFGPPEVQIDEQMILSMEPAKLYEIAYSLFATHSVWEVINSARKQGTDVSRFVAEMPPPDDHDSMWDVLGPRDEWLGRW